jgi:hypothetical protein
MLCDNCEQQYEPDAIRTYGTDSLGLRYCNACKMPHIEDVIERAQGLVTRAGLDRVEAAMARVRTARQLGQWDVADALTEAAFQMANSLHNELGIRPDVLAGRQAQKQRSDAGFSSGEQRRADREPKWNEWQAAVDKVRAEQPKLKKSRVFEIVGATFGVTRPAIAKHVNW